METPYTCICGARTLVYLDHQAEATYGYLNIECLTCGLGKDRTFVFPPEEDERVYYALCLPLFREIGMDAGFHIDPLTWSITDPYEKLWKAAEALLNVMDDYDLDPTFLIDWLAEQGIEVETDDDPDPVE